MEKRVLIFSVAYAPFIGGAEVAVEEIIRRLRQDGFSFDIITVNLDGKQKAEETIEGSRVFRVGRGTRGKFLFPFLGLKKALKLHRQNPYAISWSIMASQASIAGAFFKMVRPSVPLVLTLQEGDGEDHLTRYAFGSTFIFKLLIRPWHRLVFKKSDAVTAISHALRYRALQNKVRVPVSVIPNGVDLKVFQKDYRFERTKLRHELQLEDNFVLITTSRLVKKNAIEDIIESLRFLSERVTLLIVGGGFLESELKLQVQKLGLEKRVHFVGAVPPKEIPRYLAVGDVFVRPSLSEGMGNSFIEAMATGLPVIATPVGGIPDFLKDKQTGLFCQIKNPASIAEKVELLMKDQKLVERIKTGGLRVAEEHDWGHIAHAMRTEVFEPLLR